MVKAREVAVRTRYTPCGKCHNGMVAMQFIYSGNPERALRDCECKIAWRRENGLLAEDASIAAPGVQP